VGTRFFSLKFRSSRAFIFSSLRFVQCIAAGGWCAQFWRISIATESTQFVCGANRPTQRKLTPTQDKCCPHLPEFYAGVVRLYLFLWRPASGAHAPVAISTQSQAIAFQPAPFVCSNPRHSQDQDELACRTQLGHCIELKELDFDTRHMLL
jgi:hypothetical protein